MPPAHALYLIARVGCPSAVVHTTSRRCNLRRPAGPAPLRSEPANGNGGRAPTNAVIEARIAPLRKALEEAIAQKAQAESVRTTLEAEVSLPAGCLLLPIICHLPSTIYHHLLLSMCYLL